MAGQQKSLERSLEKIIYEINDIPDSLNKFAGRKNCWEYREQKNAWKLLVQSAVGRNKPKEPYNKSKVHVHYIFPTKVRRDPDNYVPKAIMDGLTASGVILDDSFKCVELKLSAEYQKGIKKTIIEVEE